MVETSWVSTRRSPSGIPGHGAGRRGSLDLMDRGRATSEPALALRSPRMRSTPSSRGSWTAASSAGLIPAIGWLDDLRSRRWAGVYSTTPTATSSRSSPARTAAGTQIPTVLRRGRPEPLPEARYTGDGGKVVFAAPPDQEPDLSIRTEAPSTAWLAAPAPRASSACTGGRSPQARADLTRTSTEALRVVYVLSGTIRLYDGKAWINGRPSDFLFVAEDGVHGFRNESGEPA